MHVIAYIKAHLPGSNNQEIQKLGQLQNQFCIPFPLHTWILCNTERNAQIRRSHISQH